MVMKTGIVAVALMLLCASRATAETRAWDFEAEKPDTPPSGFVLARTGSGAPGRWVVRTEVGAPSGQKVLAQVDSAVSGFALAIAQGPAPRDLRVDVHCKPISGKEDQACGLVFRYQDENNYYVTRANALENNVRLYFVKNGGREQIASWDGKVASGTWHRLGAVAKGDHLEVYWEGQKIIEKTDKTFAGPGRAGVWTKADSVTSFDDLRIESLDGANASAAGELRQIQTIPLPGVTGRIDHLAVDVAGQRLFVAALGNNTVEAVDLKKGARVESLPGFKEPQGIAYMPETNTVVVANGGDGVVTLLDGASLKPRKTIALGGDADNIRYDPSRRRLYVGYGDGALGILDATTGARLKDVALDGHPESFQLETAGRIFVNVEPRQKIAVIDAAKQAVTATWPLVGASANFPMALDETHHRLFVATRKPPHLLVFDTETGKTVGTLDVDGDADDLFYDAARQRVYACFGAGFVAAFMDGGADHYKLVQRVETAAGARTGLFSPQLDRLFVAVPSRAAPVAEIRIFEIGE
jgi:hypothetical protein